VHRKIAFYIFFFYLFLYPAISDEKQEIIKKLNNTHSLTFNFIQNNNQEIENGKCIILFPGKMKCTYFDKNKKEIIINKKSLAITQKRYNKTYFYPIGKSHFINILDKKKLINTIKNSQFIQKNESINLILENKNKEKIILIFDKEKFILKGWIINDRFNNLINFQIKIISTNDFIEENEFKIPERN